MDQAWDARYLREVRLSQPCAPKDYWAALPAVQQLERQGGISFASPITFFVGENGTGKSTLLEAIATAWGLNPEGGSRNFSFATAETHAGLWRQLRLTKGVRRPQDSFFLRAESFYNTASYLEQIERDGPPGLFAEYGGRSPHTQSHGESFLALALHRFRGQGLYLLDEPEAALSPTRLLTLLSKIDQLAREGSQFVIATHSPMLMACPGSRLLLFDEAGITPTDYRQTAHYQITRSFLENPERMLQILCG